MGVAVLAKAVETLEGRGAVGIRALYLRHINQPCQVDGLFCDERFKLFPLAVVLMIGSLRVIEMSQSLTLMKPFHPS